MNSDEELLSRLENKNWQFESEGCEANSFHFIIHDLNSFDLVYDNPIVVDDREPNDLFVYTIIDIKENVIQTQMEGEYRFDDQNKPIGWDIILQGDNTFYWRITKTTQRFGPVIVCN